MKNMDRQFIGKNANEEESLEAKEKLRDIGLEPIAGEKPKTEQELQLISLAVSGFKKLFEQYGIEKTIDITPEQIHFTDCILFGGSVVSGMADVGQESIATTKKQEIFSLLEIHCFAHEMAHLLSHTRHFASAKDEVAGDKEVEVTSPRAGFALERPWNKEENGEIRHFVGFNEAMTEIIVKKILYAISEELEKEFKIKEEELAKSHIGKRKLKYIPFVKKTMVVSYQQMYVPTVEEIIKKMAEIKSQTLEEITDQLIKAYFNGESPMLGDIEKTFGTGSARILSYLGSQGKEVEELIADYFFVEDVEVRKEIKGEIDDLMRK